MTWETMINGLIILKSVLNKHSEIAKTLNELKLLRMGSRTFRVHKNGISLSIVTQLYPLCHVTVWNPASMNIECIRILH
jgi:hypothetical protein